MGNFIDNKIASDLNQQDLDISNNLIIVIE